MRAAIAGAAVAAVVLAACTYELRDPGITRACGAIRYEINPGPAGTEQRTAVSEAMDSYAALVNRDVEYLGVTDVSVMDRDRTAEDPVLVEFSWPGDAPTRYGFAEPLIEDGHYVGGFIYINPILAEAPPDIIRRLTMHELGHLGGLADIDAIDEMMNPELTASDWGPGDIVGLRLTHPTCSSR